MIARNIQYHQHRKQATYTKKNTKIKRKMNHQLKMYT